MTKAKRPASPALLGGTNYLGKLSHAALRKLIHEHRADIEARSGTVGAIWPRNPSSLSLLGSSTKVEKVVDGVNEGYLMAVQYLAPADEAFPEDSGRSTCPFATTCWKFKPGNRRASMEGENPSTTGCLVISGQMAIPRNMGTRIWKTSLYFGWPDAYRALLRLEIAALEKKAARDGKRAAVRLDGTSDLGYASRIAPEFPGVQFWDYTKVPARTRSKKPENLHITFSYDGSYNGADAADYLSRGGNVSAVLNIAAPKGNASYPELPEGFEIGGEYWPVISGDETDARFTDPEGTVNLLTFKQKTKGGEVLAWENGFANNIN